MLSSHMLAAAAALLAVEQPGGAEQIMISAAEVRLGDLAALEGFGRLAQGGVANRIVAALPAGRSRIETTRAALADLVRRSVPSLALAVGRGDRPVTIRRRAAPGSRDGVRDCRATAGPIAAGAILSAPNLLPVACDSAPGRAAIRFDRRERVLRTAEDLEAGAYLGRVAVGPGVSVDRGAELRLVSTVGPVRISRPVIALQSARAGERLFVRDEDGTVFPVLLAGGVEDRR